MNPPLLQGQDALEHFEKRVRPVLVANCVKCHGPEKQRQGLRVDSRERLIRGGETGPAVVPGEPEASLLLSAIRHEDYEMPPSGKLTNREIAAIERWIGQGAVWPEENVSGSTVDDAAAEHWSFQPVTRPEFPAESAAQASTHLVDRWIDWGLRQAAVESSGPADRATLLRRVTFDLTGLPPTPEELHDFLSDDSSDAYEQIVDRLLDSPQFGEHMARHWMDVVRYGETHGSEKDASIPHAWRYRDYLIRAFNRDVPYDQLVREHIAGDLLSSPRRHPTEGFNESVIGTTFYRFVEFYPSPVDVKAEEATVIDNQIDALGKAFQGLTLACARCHDHKFDPVTTADYYALYGIISSSRLTSHVIDPPEELARWDNELRAIKSKLRSELAEKWLTQVAAWQQTIPDAIAAAASRELPNEKQPGAETSEPVGEEAVEAIDGEQDRDPVAVWTEALRQAREDVANPLHPLAEAARMQRQDADSSPLSHIVERYRQDAKQRGSHLEQHFELTWDLSQRDHGWYSRGLPFRHVSRPGDFAVTTEGEACVAAVYPAGMYSHLLSDKHGGTLRSPSFTLDERSIAVLVCGSRDAQVRLVIENFQSDYLLFSTVSPKLDDLHVSWYELPIRTHWIGRQAYVELVPRDDRGYVGRVPNVAELPKHGRSAAGIRMVGRITPGQLPMPESPLSGAFFDQINHSAQSEDREDCSEDGTSRLVRAFRNEIARAITGWTNGSCDDRQARLLDELVRLELLQNSFSEATDVGTLLAEYRAVESRVPVPTRVLGIGDEFGGEDCHIFRRGDYRNRGPLAPRRDFAVARRAPTEATMEGSGRQFLADSIARRDNPLTARVMVNRLWHWTFGRGLVATVDNFGLLGERPTHPQLLDELAIEFMESDWSIKHILRLLVTSECYRRSSVPVEASHELDPAGRLWHAMPVRRLPAEAIRDAMLAVASELRESHDGPGIPVAQTKSHYTTVQPDGGPLDGAGRRSIYLEVRRNYQWPFFRVFDQPVLAEATGRRDVTNTPQQSLTLLNDPFVHQQAQRFAARLLSEVAADVDQRIVRMYRLAFSRDPLPPEIEQARSFLSQQRERHGHPAGTADHHPEIWTDLAHAVLNFKEFIYVP